MVRLPGSVWGLDVPESRNATTLLRDGGRQSWRVASPQEGAWKEDVRQEAAQGGAITDIMSFHCRAESPDKPGSQRVLGSEGPGLL